MKAPTITIPGTLVSFPLKSPKARPLDGFLVRGKTRSRHLTLFLHGMGGNFYRSRFKKEMMLASLNQPFDVLSFNNRGYESSVATERFRDCLMDLDAALDFGHKQGYRTFTLIGHSTGCQKVAYYQAVRNRKDIKGLVLAAIGDDYAICRRDLGKRHAAWVRRAEALVASGRGDTLLPAKCLGFSAERFLSIAKPEALEASIFHFDGPMKHFRRIRIPMLGLFPAEEEFACIPVDTMGKRLGELTRSPDYRTIIIPGADHSFHGKEKEAAKAITRWLRSLIV